MSSWDDDAEQARAARRAADQRARRTRRRTRRLIALGLLAAVATVAAVLASQGSPPRPRDAVVTTTQRATGRAATVAPPRDGPPGTEPVPILMYHVIAPPLPSAAYPGLYVPPAEFAAQMVALARAGYHAVTLDQVRSYWLHGTALPAKPIVLSFDNGYRTQYTVALPLLRRLHWVGDENLQLSGLPPSQGGLSAREVRALVAAGWELDTQGYSHADLTTLDAAELHFQVAVARRTLRRLYHVRADWFCYPSGRYNATVVAAVRAAGFVGSTTTIPGWAARDDDPYRLPRLRVLGGTSPQQLLALVAGSRGYAPPPSAYLSG